VIAEFGLHQTGKLILSQAEHAILERLDHHATPKKAKISPFFGRSGILRMLPGQLGKSRRRLLDFLQHIFRLGACFFPVHLAARQNQDMTGSPLLGLLVTILVALVPSCHFSIAGLDLRQQSFERQEHVLDLGLLRHFKALQVLCIVFLDGRQRDFHLVGKLPRGESPLGNLPLLGLYAQQLIDHLIASNAGISNCADQLLEREILSHLRLELGL